MRPISRALTRVQCSSSLKLRFESVEYDIRRLSLRLSRSNELCAPCNFNFPFVREARDRIARGNCIHDDASLVFRKFRSKSNKLFDGGAGHEQIILAKRPQASVIGLFSVDIDVLPLPSQWPQFAKASRLSFRHSVSRERATARSHHPHPGPPSVPRDLRPSLPRAPSTTYELFAALNRLPLECTEPNATLHRALRCCEGR
jgi:hypothetical protein